MLRDDSRTSWLPVEGGQGREAPKGSLDGPGRSTRSLIAAVVGPQGLDGPQVNLGDGQGHGPRLTVPYVYRELVAERVT